MAGAAVHILNSIEDDTHGDGWCWAPLYMRCGLPVHNGALLLQIYKGGKTCYPGGDHLMVQDDMLELPYVRGAHI
jgi:hypothetical protein